jgi:hypothetical protein
MKAELALVQEQIAWTRRQLCRVDECISSLNEELWMALKEEHYATAKTMISASSTKTLNKASFCSNKFTWYFHKQNYYMFYRHATVQRT